VLTGLNAAFVIDDETREALIAEDPKSAEIIKPILRGRDIRRWRARWPGLWLIYSHSGVEERDYPEIRTHCCRIKRNSSHDVGEPTQRRARCRTRGGSYKGQSSRPCRVHELFSPRRSSCARRICGRRAHRRLRAVPVTAESTWLFLTRPHDSRNTLPDPGEMQQRFDRQKQRFYRTQLIIAYTEEALTPAAAWRRVTGETLDEREAARRVQLEVEWHQSMIVSLLRRLEQNLSHRDGAVRDQARDLLADVLRDTGVDG